MYVFSFNWIEVKLKLKKKKRKPALWSLSSLSEPGVLLFQIIL